MNRVLYAGLAMVLSCATALAQPKKPEHTKKVFKKEGDTYVQKSLPVYLSFSTEPQGEQHRLTSKKTKEYADPMYLDTEGVNYIRSHWAVDKSTGKTVYPQVEILYELYADGLAPATSIDFYGAPYYRAGGTTYYGQGLEVSLASRDGVSGVEAIHYALNASSYSKYTQPLSINTEKAHTLYYYAFDHVGNDEAAHERNFTVDLSAPNSDSRIDGITHQNNILAPSAKFVLSSKDNLSGVRTTYYSFDDGADRGYYSPISIAGLSDGEHVLKFYAIDNVKNKESVESFSFYLDKIPPVPTNKVIGDQHRGNYLYVSPRTTVNLAATDNKAGVKNIMYAIDGGSSSAFNSDFKIPDALGVHYVRYTSTDNVENTSKRNTLTVYMDNRAPNTGINYGSPQFFARDTLFINKDTRITLRKSDAHSGLQSTEYMIDNGSFKTYAPFTIPAEGHHVVNFRSTDNVNNIEQTKESKVFVDNTGPEIYVNFSIEPIGKKDGKQLYPNYTRLYIGATDEHCGTDNIMYSINGEPMRAYSSPYSLDISEVNNFTSEKKYTVKIVASDKLGNTAEKEVEFYVGTNN